MADVFISYKREDRAWAERIAARLQVAGYTVWWDTYLIAGEAFVERINTELDTAKCVVVIWSEASMQSNWVRSEALHGLNRKPPALVACRADDVALCVPFNSLHTVDLRTPRGEQLVVDGVERLVEVKPSPKSPPLAGLFVTQPDFGPPPAELSPYLALRWAQAAAGDKDALTELGWHFEMGFGGLSRNDREAEYCYLLAAENGHPLAQNNLGTLFERGRIPAIDGQVEAARLYRLAAEQGFPSAQANLGRLFETGRGGIAQDVHEAVRLYRLAAQQGDEWAQDRLRELGETV